jgi:type VI secretion system protein ImpI/type VI secretion system protein
VEGGEFSIGRGPENDWVLADPERYLSKRHCVVAFHSGGWKIADYSTNGTFLNRDSEPLGRGRVRDLRNGDRLHLGSYEIEIRLIELPVAQRVAQPANPFDLDPFAPRSTPSGQDPMFAAGGGDPLGGAFASSAINLPADYDPLAPDPASDRGMIGPAQADHSPHLNDAFSGAVAHAVLPEDWDREFAPQAAPARTADPVETLAPPPVPAPPPALPKPPVAAPAVRYAGPDAGDDLLAAFLRGAGIDDLRPADPVATMEALGGTFREVVFGLRQVMIARAAIKAEFRIEQTGIRRRGNNPLKFSANDDDALAALVGVGRRTDMAPVEAVAEALSDIRLHELASIAAMQAAVRALMAELEPGKLQRSAGESGLNFVPAQRKARAWDAFEAQFTRVSQALADRSDSVFAKAFARAYDKALAEAAAKENGR